MTEPKDRRNIWNNDFQDTGLQALKVIPSERRETNEVSPTTALKLLLWETFRPQHREGGDRWNLMDFMNWGDRAENLEFTRQSTWEEGHAQRENSRGLQRNSSEFSGEDCLVHMCKETYSRLGKEPLKWIKGNSAWNPHRAWESACNHLSPPVSRVEILGHWRDESKGLCLHHG